MAKGTEKAYAYDWRRFTAFCERAGRQSLPASPETLALFVADQLRTHKVTTVSRDVVGVSWYHRHAGLPSPATDAVFKTLRGARRLRAEQPRQMRPLTILQLRQVAGILNAQATPIAKRDRALVLVGFGTGLRRANLAGLRMEDVTLHEEGLVILVRHEKQDRRGDGRLVAVPFGQNEVTCPVRALEAWLAIRGPAPAAWFNTAATGAARGAAPFSDPRMPPCWLAKRLPVSGFSSSNNPRFSAGLSFAGLTAPPEASWAVSWSWRSRALLCWASSRAARSASAPKMLACSSSP